MATHKIDNTSLTVHVKESDEHTMLTHVKIERNIEPENIQSSVDMFLTVEQLDSLGKFILNQADGIRCDRHLRK